MQSIKPPFFIKNVFGCDAGSAFTVCTFPMVTSILPCITFKFRSA